MHVTPYWQMRHPSAQRYPVRPLHGVS
jgi:hypothetical protein